MPLPIRVVVVVAAVLLASCGGDAAPDAGGTGTPLVVASFYPLAYAAEEVAGDGAAVEDLTPPGVEPHDLELSPGQVRLLHRADLVLYLGEGFQPALESVAVQLGSGAVDLLDAVEVRGPDDEDDGHEDDGHGHDPDAADPHVWLDPERMQAIVVSVSERLSELDPANSAVYERNAAAVAASLTELDEDMQQGLADCATRDLVVGHEAFGYLAARYDLNEVGIAGLDPEAEPSPQRLAEVVRFARDHDVRTIFFERTASPGVAETVAREVGAATAVLDPLETGPETGDFIDAMRANLESLRAGLNCS